MSYRLTLPIFDGPFDLLLHLIKIDEVDITEVSLAAVAERYMEIIQLMQDLDLDLVGDYLVIAASLIELKSRALLPAIELPDEDEEEFGEDPRHELIEQILQYRTYRDLSRHLGDRAKGEQHTYFRSFREAVEARTVDQIEAVNLYDLLAAFQRVLEYADADEFREIIDDDVHVEECIAYMRRRLQESKSLRLIELAGSRLSRRRLIGMFLAMLELIRMAEIVARPTPDNADIRLVWRPPSERPRLPAAAGIAVGAGDTP